MSVGRVFEAIQDGVCGSCGEEYEAGDPVRRWDESICHDGCTEGEEHSVIVMRNAAGHPVAIPEEVVIASERPYRAYQLKKGGHSWEQIALAEDYPDWKAARADVQRYLAEGASLIADFKRRELLQMDLDRLEDLLRFAWPMAQKHNLAAINQAHGLVLSHAKLLRLDQDIRDDESPASNGRTVVVGSDEEAYAKGLEIAARDGSRARG